MVQKQALGPMPVILVVPGVLIDVRLPRPQRDGVPLPSVAAYDSSKGRRTYSARAFRIRCLRLRRLPRRRHFPPRGRDGRDGGKRSRWAVTTATLPGLLRVRIRAAHTIEYAGRAP